MAVFLVIVTTPTHPDEKTLYLISGSLTPSDIQRLVDTLLTDPITQQSTWYDLGRGVLDTLTQPVDEVAYRPGVTDNEAESIAVGARHLSVPVAAVRTLRRYPQRTTTTPVRHNDLIELCQTFTPGDASARIVFYQNLVAAPTPRTSHIAAVPIRVLDDAGLVLASTQGLVALDLDEMRTIQTYFRTVHRDPTDGELETIAQTWSEHCSHKTFKGRVVYTGDATPLPAHSAHLHPALQELGTSATIDSLIKTHLMRATNATAPNLKNLTLISAFVDNAGILAFDADTEVSFKVETHNHPSALEPFGGANTGMGGVLRDVLGVSAKPIAATDVFCFGPAHADLSAYGGTVLPTLQVAHGVVAGVQDYGNKIGVPIVNGAVFYDPGYIANPLVFCGTVGLAPRNSHPRNVSAGDTIVVLGGRTGRDGIHGATFSSIELTHTTAQEAGSAVQIGDPITEKKLIDIVIQARDARLYSAITDCGAGGLSSAIGEMGEQIGANVELTTVPLKYAGLQPWEIWLSEAQERIVMAVPPQHLSTLLAMCAAEEVEATAVGTFDGSGRLTVTYVGRSVVDLDMHFLHDGRPQRTLTATWQADTSAAPQWQPRDHAAVIAALLSHPNIASREPIIRGYDHEIQGRSIIKPLVGAHSDGPGDAAVLQIHPHTMTGIALGCGMAPQLSQFDPYWMALLSVDEALRNVVAVGADPTACAILDNFCWGDPKQADRMGGLTRATAGCHDAALAYGTPFISGKDSLNNEYRNAQGVRTAIPGTLLISALAYHPDIRHSQTSDLKAAGNALYIVGTTDSAMAGAHVSRIVGAVPGSDWRIPQVDLAQAPSTLEHLHHAIQKGLVAACHDLSEGGLAVAVAEMALAGRLGADIELDALPTRSDSVWVRMYSESPTRFLVEVSPAHEAAFTAAMAHVTHARIGTVRTEPRVIFTHQQSTIAIVSIDSLVDAFHTDIL